MYMYQEICIEFLQPEISVFKTAVWNCYFFDDNDFNNVLSSDGFWLNNNFCAWWGWFVVFYSASVGQSKGVFNDVFGKSLFHFMKKNAE